MRIALYLEDGLEQVVLTPETDAESSILEKLHDGTRELSIYRGSFYDCRGGWKRYTPFQPSSFAYGTDSGDESTLIVLRPASGMEARQGGDVKQAPSQSDDSPSDAQKEV